jgi:hypothetical protein
MRISSFVHENVGDDFGVYTNLPLFASKGRDLSQFCRACFGMDDPSGTAVVGSG